MSGFTYAQLLEAHAILKKAERAFQRKMEKQIVGNVTISRRALDNKKNIMLESAHSIKENTVTIHPPKKLSSAAMLEKMLEKKSFDQLLADGEILDVQMAAKRSGYTAQHVRRLCRENRIAHIRRGLVAEEVCFYFFPSQLRGLFSYHKARA